MVGVEQPQEVRVGLCVFGAWEASRRPPAGFRLFLSFTLGFISLSAGRKLCTAIYHDFRRRPLLSHR